MRGRYVKKFIPFHRDEIVYKIPEIIELSKQAKLRLRWMDHYRRSKNVSLSCRHFDISRKTFYKWYKRFEVFGIKGLEDFRKGPHTKRQPEISRDQEIRIIGLRKEYKRYGKEKLAVIYGRVYGEKISSWKIYRVIRKYDLYWDSIKNEKLRKKRKMGEKKKRITELRNKQIEEFLFQVDTKVIWCYSAKRYIFTAVEKKTKIGFARMYTSSNSYSGRDFLLRLYFLVNQKFFYVQSDNGNKFGKYFEDACKQLGLQHYFSPVTTPKDHAEIERFNKTIDQEFLQMGHYIDDVDLFNPLLTEWLVEYNFNRPHQSLGYLTPMEFVQQKQSEKVLPIYSTRTTI